MARANNVASYQLSAHGATGKRGLNVARGDTGRSLALGLDLGLNGLVVGSHASTSQSSARQSFTLGTQVLTVSFTFLIAM